MPLSIDFSISRRRVMPAVFFLALCALSVVVVGGLADGALVGGGLAVCVAGAGSRAVAARLLGDGSVVTEKDPSQATLLQPNLMRKSPRCGTPQSSAPAHARRNVTISLHPMQKQVIHDILTATTRCN